MDILFKCPSCGTEDEIDLDVDFVLDEQQTFEEDVTCEQCSCSFTVKTEIWLEMDCSVSYDNIIDKDNNEIIIDKYTGNLFEHAGVEYPSRP